MATTRVDGTFSLAYVVFNSINNVTTQDGQVATFANAAGHLEPGGCFVVEVGVQNRQRLEVFDLSDTHVGVDELDFDTQRLVSHHFSLVDGEWRRASVPFRSVSPAELDLMARLAGMELRERWADWDRSPFTAESTKHVSVWEKPAWKDRAADRDRASRDPAAELADAEELGESRGVDPGEDRPLRARRRDEPLGRGRARERTGWQSDSAGLQWGGDRRAGASSTSAASSARKRSCAASGRRRRKRS